MQPPKKRVNVSQTQKIGKIRFFPMVAADLRRDHTEKQSQRGQLQKARKLTPELERVLLEVGLHHDSVPHTDIRRREAKREETALPPVSAVSGGHRRPRAGQVFYV